MYFSNNFLWLNWFNIFFVLMWKSVINTTSRTFKRCAIIEISRIFPYPPCYTYYVQLLAAMKYHCLIETFWTNFPYIPNNKNCAHMTDQLYFLKLAEYNKFDILPILDHYLMLLEFPHCVVVFALLFFAVFCLTWCGA